MSTHTGPSQTVGASELGAARRPPTRHHQIVVVGGGSGGITVAAQLCRKLKDPDVAIIEPSETHDYQPLWTLVGGGVVHKEQSRHHERDVIPAKATWLRETVTEFDPEHNEVVLADGSRVGYDFLIVAVGIQLNWEAIDGMRADLVGRHGICSNYLYDGCEVTWATLQDFEGGTALFTMPAAADQVRRRAAEDHVPRRRPLRGGPACATGRGSSSPPARPASSR